MFDETEDRRLIWEQLLRLAEGGDLRAIKLYYDMLEKKERQQKSNGNDDDRDMEQMAAIRRAVFGDAMIGGMDSAAEDHTREEDDTADI